MKKTLVLALALLFVLGGAAWAATYDIGVGVTYAVGDTVVLPGETWILEDDSPVTPKDRDAGSYPVLEVTKNNPTYSQGKIQLQGEAFFGTYPIDIYVTKPADKKADDPIGFRIKSGSGTEADPYAFEFVYELNASSFTVYFNNNGGAGQMSSISDVTGEYALPECRMSPPTGYAFSGWKVENTGNLLQPGDTIDVSANVTLYAQWTQREYSLEVSDGTATFNGVTGTEFTGLHYGDQVSVTANEPGEYEVFVDWRTTYGGSFASWTSMTTTYTMPAHDASIFAYYEDVRCFQDGGDSVLYPYEGDAPLPAEPGDYRLTGDVTLTETWAAPEGVTRLCLHNHKITMTGVGPVITVGSGATLYLYGDDQIDDNPTNLISGGTGGGIVVNGGSLYLKYDGVKPGGNDNGIVVNSGAATLDGRCTIRDNAENGVVVNGGTCVLEAGLIKNNGSCGVLVTGGSFIAHSKIKNNGEADVCVSGGSFSIGRPEIGIVWLANGQTIGITKSLSGLDAIAVALESGSGVFTAGLSGKGGAENFVSADAENFAVTLTGDGETKLRPTSPLRLPNDTRVIEANAFENIGAYVVYVPAACVSIGAEAFKGCENLEEIHIAATTISIDPTAFDDCGAVRVYGMANSDVESYCEGNRNLTFFPEE